MSTESKSYFETFDFTPDAPGTYENLEHNENLVEITQELKDNSDDAKAKQTDIFLLPNDDRFLDEFAHLDNGKGMDEEKLYSAIKMAKRHNHELEDTGKFGVGLKNGVFALGEEIFIMSKTKDSNPIAVFLNVKLMKKAESWRPTSSADPSKYKDMIDNDIYEMFSSYESGTLIYVKKIRSQHQMKVEEAAREISHKFELANSSTRGNTLYIHTDTKKLSTIPIEPIDVFYRKNPSDLEDIIETTLKVCIFSDRVEVYEYLEGVRYRGSRSGNKHIGSLGNATIWKFTGVLPDKSKGVNRRAYDKECHQQVDSLPTNAASIEDMKLRTIRVKDTVYSKEITKYPALKDVENRRRGYWYYRNDRLLSAANSPKDVSLDDHSNRVRIEVRFTPKLDKYMGVRTQKTMGTITNKAISNALHVFWKQIETKLCKKSENDDATTVADDDDRSTVISVKGKKTAAKVAPAPAPAVTAKKSKTLKVAPAAQSIVEIIKERASEEVQPEVEHEETTNQVLSVSSGEVSESDEAPLPNFETQEAEEAPQDLQITRFVESHTPSPPSSPVPTLVSRPECVVGNIRFDITPTVVIVSRTDDNVEVARISANSNASGLRDWLMNTASRMNNPSRFIEYVRGFMSLNAEFNV